jgi:hypothetical protein
VELAGQQLLGPRIRAFKEKPGFAPASPEISPPRGEGWCCREHPPSFLRNYGGRARASKS